VVTEEKLDEISTRFIHAPCKFLRHLLWDTGISEVSVQTVIKPATDAAKTTIVHEF